MPNVIVYADANFAGARQELGPGQFDIGQLSIGNDTISSLRVPSGWTVTLYEHAGFQGRAKTFTSDTAYVGDDFNDLTSAISVVAQPGNIIPPDTQNALTDFDFCLALSEQAINSQVAHAWTGWLGSAGFSDTLDMFKTLKNGQLVDSPFGVHVQMAPLTVSLHVPNGRPGQIQVTLHWQSGTVTYADDVTGTAAEYPIQNWSFTFVTDLDRQAVDFDALQQINPGIHSAAQQVVASAGLPDSVFAIECLFLDLTKAADLLADNKTLNVPSHVPQAAHDRGAATMRYFLQSAKPFLLGTVVRRNNQQATPTFALTDFIFAVHGSAADSDSSSLAYLGMFAQRPLPADMPAALGKLTDSWLHVSSASPISGVVALGKDAFMNRYLVPQFTQRIGSAPTFDTLTWSFNGGSPSNWTSSDIIDREWDLGKNWNLTITIVPSTNTLNISGRVDSHAYMDGYTKTVDFGLFSLGHYHTEWIHMQGHQDLSGTVTLNAAGNATNFTLTPNVNYAFSGIVVDNDTVAGGANVLTAFEGAFTGGTTAERLQSQQQDLVHTLHTWLDQVLQNIQLDLNQHSFIPPGGGVFTFQRPRFSNAGDLLFDVIYQTPDQFNQQLTTPPTDTTPALHVRAGSHW
jgi:hypothetical protein